MELEQNQIAQLTKERDELRTRAEQAEAAGAEMRKALQSALSCGLNEEPAGVGFTPSKQEIRAQQVLDLINHALSTSCGTGWVSPEKVKRLEEALIAASPYVPHKSRWVSKDGTNPARILIDKALAATATKRDAKTIYEANNGED